MANEAEHPVSVTSVGAETPKEPNNRKKWLIGCGGCLGLLLLITIALGVLGVGCWNQFQKSSDKTVQAIFDGHVPADRFAVGVPLPGENGAQTHVVMLIDPNDRHTVMFAFDTILKPEQAAVIRQHKNAQDFGEKLKPILQETGIDNAAARGNAGLEQLRLENSPPITLAGGQTIPTVAAKLESGKGEYSPVAGGLILHPNNRLVGLFALDAGTKTTDPKADFSHNYANLRDSIKGLAEETHLADKAAEGKPGNP